MPKIDGTFGSDAVPESEGAGVMDPIEHGSCSATACSVVRWNAWERQRRRRDFRAPTAYLIDFYWLSSSI